MVKYHIILDTTELYTEGLRILDLNKPVLEFIEFVEENLKDIELYIPKIVLDERSIQNAKIFNSYKDKIIDNYKAIKETGLKGELEELEEFGIKHIRSEILKCLKKNKIKIIDYPKVDSKIILEKYSNDIRPFNNIFAKNEKGFKDTFIWHSILDFSNKNKKDIIIFITKNIKDFPLKFMKEEFKRVIGNNNLEIFENLEKTKEYFDSQLKLGLNLQEDYEKVEKVIILRIDDIMYYIHEYNEESLTGLFIPHRNEYSYFKFEYINYIIDIINLGNEITAKVNLRITGYYDGKAEGYLTSRVGSKLLGTPRTDAFISGSPLLGGSSFRTGITGLKSDDLSVDIDVTIDIETEKLSIDNLKINGYSF